MREGYDLIQRNHMLYNKIKRPEIGQKVWIWKNEDIRSGIVVDITIDPAYHRYHISIGNTPDGSEAIEVRTLFNIWFSIEDACKEIVAKGLLNDIR